jgi:hypothetical protein
MDRNKTYDLKPDIIFLSTVYLLPTYHNCYPAPFISRTPTKQTSTQRSPAPTARPQQ